MDGYKTLKAGQLVTFDAVDGPKGLHAANIRAVESASEDHVVLSDSNDESELMAPSATEPVKEPAEELEEALPKANAIRSAKSYLLTDSRVLRCA